MKSQRAKIPLPEESTDGQRHKARYAEDDQTFRASGQWHQIGGDGEHHLEERRLSNTVQNAVVGLRPC